MRTHRLIMALGFGLVMAGCYPPQIQYPYTKLVQSRRTELHKNLLDLLPEEQRKNPAAEQEARWLADTAYKAAAGISRINASHFPGWAGNTLVNSRLQDRGLCWHYQHDMYRELRRRKLSFFRIGCCVRDKSESSEHNCVYVAPAHAEWPHVWVLDAWIFNGRLKVNHGEDLDKKRWQDLPTVCTMLSRAYEEGHTKPVEHWYILRGKDGKYCVGESAEGIGSSQYNRMNENIKRGYREHPGSLTNY